MHHRPSRQLQKSKNRCRAVWALLATAWSSLAPSVLPDSLSPKGTIASSRPELENKGTPRVTLDGRTRSPARAHLHIEASAPLPDMLTGSWRRSPGAYVTTWHWDLLSWTRKVEKRAIDLCFPLSQKCVHLSEIRDGKIKTGGVLQRLWLGTGPRPHNKKTHHTRYLWDRNSHSGGINGNFDPHSPVTYPV